MANYKIALQLYQSQVGDENAEVKISVNGTIVADNVEVSNSNSETPTLFVYDVTDLPDPGEDDGMGGRGPGGDATTVVKVELLNDLYVDSNNDRNIYWTGCGYAAQSVEDENYYRSAALPEGASVHEPGADAAVPAIIITDWTDLENFNWADGSEYQGDENGTVDTAAGWHLFAITSTYVSATVPLTNPKVTFPVPVSDQ
jgi:hypothetical protein